jgi:hypothetical protein
MNRGLGRAEQRSGDADERAPGTRSGEQGRRVGQPRSGSHRLVRAGEREREASEAQVNQIKFELFQTYSSLT